MSTTFSVVMPAFNTAHTIQSAIQSVLRQTRDDFELIVVDDGSNDDTVRQVAPYLGDSRVTLVEQANAGPSAARNTAIAHATGEWVSFLDSDDLWLPRYLEVMAATLTADPGAAAAYTDAWVLYDELKKIARATAMREWQPTTVPRDADTFLRVLLENGNFVYNAVTVRRTVLLEVGGFRESLRSSVDYELWLRLAARGHRFVRAPETLAVYRRRKTGQITTDPMIMVSQRREVFRLVLDEYDVPDELRELVGAQLLAHERLAAAPAAEKPRRGHRIARILYRPIWLLRWFYVRPPKDVRTAFPVLRDV